MKNTYHYTVKMFNPDNQLWETKNRYYSVKKDLNDFDLKDIPGKRMDAKFIEQLIPGDYTGYELKTEKKHKLMIHGMGATFTQAEWNPIKLALDAIDKAGVQIIMSNISIMGEFKPEFTITHGCPFDEEETKGSSITVTPDLIKIKKALTGRS